MTSKEQIPKLPRHFKLPPFTASNMTREYSSNYRHLVALDLEFNLPSRRIVQVGAVVGDLVSGDVVAEFSSLVQTFEKLSFRVKWLTGLSASNLRQAKGLDEVYLDFTKWLKPWSKTRVQPALTWGADDSEIFRVQVGIRSSEWDFGRRSIDAKAVYVTWRLAQNGVMPRMDLARSMKNLGLKFEGRPHDAKVDAKNTFRIFYALLAQFKNRQLTG